MKRYLILTCLFVLSTGLVMAQQANVHIKFTGAKDNNVIVQEPVEGLDFYPARIEKHFDKDSSLLVNLKIDRIARLYLTNSNKTYKFLIEPGTTSIVLDLNKQSAAGIAYKGTNAEGQLLLNSGPTEYFQNKAIVYRRADSTASGTMAKIKADESKELQPYELLLQQKKINKAFFDRVKNEITLTYLATAAYVSTDVFFSSLKPGTKVVFKKEFADLWTSIYANDPVNNAAFLNTRDFYEFARYYADYYLGAYQEKLKGAYIDRSKLTENERLAITYANMEKAFKGKTREYVLASFLLNEIFQKEYQSILVELFAKFKATYPKSRFSEFLQPSVNEIVAYHEIANKKFVEDQKLLPNYAQVNSFDELTAKFKNKTVFVDIWATWCGPCKAEFEHGSELDKFLKSKGVEMLYISMDNDAVDKQWQDMIKYYKLAGNHIRANPKLKQDLMDKLWDGKGYAIPRYLILKDGKLVVPNALRPSDKSKLYEQISSYL